MPDDDPAYRHEETDEEIHPKSLHYYLNRGGWDGEPVTEESGEAWRITSPADKAGVWRKKPARSSAKNDEE